MIISLSDDAKTVSVKVTCSEGTQGFYSVTWKADATLPWLYLFCDDGKLWGYFDNGGPHSFQRTPTAMRQTAIGSCGGWEGIPESFLCLLPEDSQEIHTAWLAQQLKSPQKTDGE